MKKIGLFLVFAGLIVTTYYSYTWIQERNVVQQYTVNEQNRMKEREEPKNIINNKVNFKKGEQIAELIVPSIEQTYPVFLGTDSDVLKKGAGMYESKWTTYPSDKGHTVISGHRDTVFRDLRFVKEGETLVLLFQGEQYKYRVKKIWVTDKDDRSVITKKDEPVLTITTCYPFYFLGNAPKRYIIEAALTREYVMDGS